MRQTQAEWKSYTDSLFLTGVAGNITAAKMRGFSDQLAENSRPSGASMLSTVLVPITLTTVPTKYDIFNSTIVDPDPNTEINPDISTDIMNFNLAWTYQVYGGVTLTGDNNAVHFAQFYRDNGTGFLPIGTVAQVTTRGAGRPVSLVLPSLAYAMNENSQIELRLWTSATTSNVDIQAGSSYLVAELIPWLK